MKRPGIFYEHSDYQSIEVSGPGFVTVPESMRTGLDLSISSAIFWAFRRISVISVSSSASSGTKQRALSSGNR